MKPRPVNPKSPGCPSPACCVVTGRVDKPLIDAGPLNTKAEAAYRAGREVHVILAEGKIEELGRLVGMVPQAEFDELRTKLEDCEAECERRGELVGGAEGLSAAEDKLREALGPVPGQIDVDGQETPDEQDPS